MKQIELTSKLVLAIIGLTSVSAILVPTYAVPQITSADIVDGTIQSVDIKNGAIQLNVHIVKEVRDIAGQSGNSVNVDCPSGEILTGGGYLANGEDIIFYQNYPLDENTWDVAAFNSGVFDHSFTAYALCIDPTIP